MESTYLTVFDSGKYSNLLQLADAKLHTEDSITFDIHRVILACKSEYFRSMFCGFNKNRREFIVPGVSGTCLAVILRYIYTEETCVNAENMAEVLRAANYLLIENFHRDVKEIFHNHLTTANCVQVLQATNQIRNEEIFDISCSFVKMKYEEIIRTNKFAMLDLSFETLKHILSSGSLCVCKESTVWETIVKWTGRDTSTRLRYVPQLLTCLARRELDENLSSSILQHDIVLQNSFMEDLCKIKDFTNSTSNLEIILNFLDNYPYAFKDSNGFRIPSHLHVISPIPHDRGYFWYITFDENLDFWQKISADFQAIHFLEVVGRHVFTFFEYRPVEKFDLVSKEWVPMQNLRFRFNVECATHIDECLYVLGLNWDRLNGCSTYTLEVYNTINDTWFHGTSRLEFDGIYISMTTLDKKIYVVGGMQDDTMKMKVFDPVSQQSSQLSPPTDYRIHFVLVTYHKKNIPHRWESFKTISKAEIYNPETDVWENLPDLPYTYDFIRAIVIKDRIIVYDGIDKVPNNTKKVSWNETARQWEKLDPTSDLRNHRFATVEDIETLRLIKESRPPNMEYEKSPFKYFCAHIK